MKHGRYKNDEGESYSNLSRSYVRMWVRIDQSARLKFAWSCNDMTMDMHIYIHILYAHWNHQSESGANAASGHWDFEPNNSTFPQVLGGDVHLLITWNWPYLSHWELLKFPPLQDNPIFSLIYIYNYKMYIVWCTTQFSQCSPQRWLRLSTEEWPLARRAPPRASCGRPCTADVCCCWSTTCTWRFQWSGSCGSGNDMSVIETGTSICQYVCMFLDILYI